ncbi:MAG: glycosyltransferase family 39 protein [Acidobacteriota bacterium]|nr:glycosyltransferase family 39 protein [Acidobacteriota bacterium]
MSDNHIQLAFPGTFTRVDILFFFAAFVFLYTQLFQLPFTPYYFEGDHIIATSNAMRMLDGEVIYRDFFHLAPPGTELVYALFFSIFGVKVWVLNIAILLLGLALTALTWYFSRQIFTGLFVYLPASIFLAIGYRLLFIDGSFRLFSVVFVLAAAAVLLNKITPRNLMIAGGMCGLASFILQPRGVVGIAGIIIFLIWENYQRGFHLKSLVRNGLYLSLSFFLILFITHSYFLYHAGFENYYFSLVTFLQKHYPNDPLSNRSAYLSELPDFQQYLEIYSPLFALSRYFRIAFPVLFYYLLVPFVYFAFLFLRWRRKTYLLSKEIDIKLMFLCIVGLTLSAGVSALSVVRLSHIAIPGIVILVWLLKQIPYSKRIAMICLVLLAVLGFSYVIQRQTTAKNYLDMPAGRAAFFSEQVYERYKWIGEQTQPGEFFFEAHHPSFYFPFLLKNPTPLYVVRDSEYTPRFQVESVVKALENNPPKLIAWPRKWTKPPDSRAAGDNLEILWQFIAKNYELQLEFSKHVDYTEHSEGDIEIWRRKN